MLDSLCWFLVDMLATNGEIMVSKSVCGKSQIEYIRENFGERAFRPERNFNAAVYDAIMVATAEGLTWKRLT